MYNYNNIDHMNQFFFNDYNDFNHKINENPIAPIENKYEKSSLKLCKIQL